MLHQHIHPHRYVKQGIAPRIFNEIQELLNDLDSGILRDDAAPLGSQEHLHAAALPAPVAFEPAAGSPSHALLVAMRTVSAGAAGRANYCRPLGEDVCVQQRVVPIIGPVPVEGGTWHG